MANKVGNVRHPNEDVVDHLRSECLCEVCEIQVPQTLSRKSDIKLILAHYKFCILDIHVLRVWTMIKDETLGILSVVVGLLTNRFVV
jgi:hypothetical protein